MVGKKVEKKEKSDVVEIKIPTLKGLRKNPWIVSTVILAILFVLVLIFNGIGYSGERISMGEDEVSQKVLDFLNSQVDGDVQLNSITNEGSYYQLVVTYQGDQVVLQASLDGDYIFTQLVPTFGEGVGQVPISGAGGIN